MSTRTPPVRPHRLERWGRRLLLLVVAMGIALVLWGPSRKRGPDADGTGGGIVVGGDPVVPGLAPGRPRAAVPPRPPQSIDPEVRSVVRVRVSDARGRPVPGAEVLMAGRSGEWLATAVSDDEDGVAVLEDPEGSVALVVQHPRHERVVTDKAPTGFPRDEILVVLPDGGVISGWVRTAAGDAPRQGAWVVARPADEGRTLGASLAHVDPAWPRTPCEPDGRFTLTGLRLGGTYDLFAGGLGWVANHRRHVTVGEDDVRLTLRALYGADLEFVLPTGESVATSWDFSVLDAGRGWSAPAGSSPLGTENPGAFLAGVAVDRGRPSWRFLVLSDAEVDAIGPFEVSSGIPGFSTTRFGVRLPRVKESIARVQVSVTPLPGAGAWHAVALRIGMPYEVPVVEPGAVVGYLRFDGASGPTLGHLVREAHFAHGVQIDGVPAGRYAIRFVPQGWPADEIESLPSLQFEVPAAGLPANVPVPDTGGVRIRFRDRRRVPEHGNLRFRLSSVDRSARTVREIRPWSGADFCLHAVPEGEYDVELTGQAGEAIYKGTARVVRGHLTLLELGEG